MPRPHRSKSPPFSIEHRRWRRTDADSAPVCVRALPPAPSRTNNGKSIFVRGARHNNQWTFGRRDRAQPGRGQNGGLSHRPRPGGRPQRGPTDRLDRFAMRYATSASILVTAPHMRTAGIDIVADRAFASLSISCGRWSAGRPPDRRAASSTFPRRANM
jgi:hypothetical protein